MTRRLNRRTALAAGVAALLLALLAGVAVGRARPSTAAVAPASAARDARDNAEAYAALWGRSQPSSAGREVRDNAEAYAALYHTAAPVIPTPAPRDGDAHTPHLVP